MEDRVSKSVNKLCNVNADRLPLRFKGVVVDPLALTSNGSASISLPANARWLANYYYNASSQF